MSKELWDERYKNEEYIYGTEPNLFLEECLRRLRPANLLLAAEGEGRNAVFAASLGCRVYAFDQSEEGRQKANKLAASKNLKIDYKISDVLETQYAANSIDMLALIYFHLPQELRRQAFHHLLQFLKPGGYLVLEAFSKKHFGNTLSGPKTLDLLYSFDDLMLDFEGMKIIEAYETHIDIDEGPLHKGPAEIIRLLLQKQ